MKRVLSTLLILVLLFTSIPIATFAADDSSTGNNDISFESNSSLGSVLSETLTDAESNTNNKSKYGFNDVKIADGNVCVDFYAESDCTLVLAVYDEDTGVMVYTDKSAITNEMNEAIFDITDLSLPEYYSIKIFMIGENKEPMCAAYEYLYETRSYQEFFDKTIDDFENDYVIQLSEETTNNFLVVNSSAVKVDSNSENNVLTSRQEDQGIYTFKNIDSKIRDLKEDDVLFYSSDNIDDIIVLKVASVDINDDTAIVKQKKTELSDVFQYVKLENETYADASSYQEAKLGEGVTLLDVPTTYKARDIDISGSRKYSQGISIKYEDNNKVFSINGVGQISIGLDAHIYYDAELFGKDYIDVYLDVSISLSLSVTFSGSFDMVDALGLSIFEDLPITILPGVDALVGVAPVIEFSASITVELSFTCALGFSYLTDVRCIKKNECSVEPNFEVNGDLELKFGLKVTVGIELIKSLELKFSGEGGYKFTGQVELYSANKSEDVIHKCKACLVGEAKKFFSIGVEVEVGWDEIKFTHAIVSQKWDFDIGIGKPFYRSLTADNFGWGECPNCEYKVTVYVTDIYSNPIAGASVLFPHETNEKGLAVFYLSKGENTLYISSPGYNSTSLSIEVGDESPNKYFICLEDESDDNGGGTGSEYGIIDAGSCGSGLAWTLYEDGELEIYGLGEMTRWSSNEDTPWFEYHDSIKRLTIQNGVKSISQGAFCGFYKNLVYINLGNSLKEIGDYAFYNCSGIKQLKLPESLQKIGAQAFSGCENINAIYIPDSVENIGNDAFRSCKNAQTLVVGDGLSAIGNAFDGCNIKRLKVGKKVSTIPMSILDSLEEIYVSTDSLYFTVDKSGVLYNKNKSHLIKVPSNYKSSEFIIPATVKLIGDSAFSNLSVLTDISIPISVNTVEKDAFSGCSSIKTVHYQGSEKTWSEIKIESGNNYLTSAQITYNSRYEDYDIYYWDDGEGPYDIEVREHALAPYFILNGKIAFCVSPNSRRPSNGVSYLYRYETQIPEIESAVIAAENSEEPNRDLVYSSLQLVIWDILGGSSDYRTCARKILGRNGQRLFDEFKSAPKNPEFKCSFFVYNTKEVPESGNYQTMATYKIIPVKEDNNTENNKAKSVSNAMLSSAPTSCRYSERLETATIGYNYTMYVVKKYLNEDVLDPENLLYMDQKTADNTAITFDFALEEPYENYKVVFIGRRNIENVHEHEYPNEWTTVRASSCSERGLMKKTCSICNEEKYVETPMISHSYSESIVPATCTENGLILYSCICGDSYSEIIYASGHSYGDNGVCDICSDYNEEYDKENNNATEKCNCNCHKSGFMGIIWKILRLFYKLFRINPVCSCGIAHY